MPVFIAFTHLLFPLFCFHPPNFLNHLLCSRCSSCSPFHTLPCSSHSTLLFSLYSALLTLPCIFQSTMLFTLCSSNSTLLLSLQSALLTLLCSSLSYLLFSLYSALLALPSTHYSVHSISLFSLYSSYFAFLPFSSYCTHPWNHYSAHRHFLSLLLLQCLQLTCPVKNWVINSLDSKEMATPNRFQVKTQRYV